MTSTTRFLTIALMGFVSTSALAGAPHASAIDNDGDGAYVPTVDINGDGTIDAADIGLRASQIDCDDSHANRSPRLTEVVGNGIDDDCDGADAVSPVSDPLTANYMDHSGAKSLLAFTVEYDRCVAAAECKVDDVAGTMKIALAFASTHVFCDVAFGSGDVVGRDGFREVQTLVFASHTYPGILSSDECQGGRSSTSSKVKGTASSVRDPIKWTNDSVAVLRSETQTLREEVLQANVLQDQEIEAIKVDINILDSAIVADRKAEVGQNDVISKALDAIYNNSQEIEELDGRVTTAQRTAGKAAEDANSALSHSPLFEGYLVTGLVMGQQIDDGDNVARNGTFGGGGAGVNLGVDGDGYRANAFGQFMFGADGADGPSNTWQLGGEYLTQLGSAHVGGNLAYGQRSSLVNALETQVLGRTPMGGLSLAVPFAPGSSGQHMVLLVRADIGAEFIGMVGDSVTDSVRPAGMLTIGLGGGVGAVR